MAGVAASSCCTHGGSQLAAAMAVPSGLVREGDGAGRALPGTRQTRASDSRPRWRGMSSCLLEKHICTYSSCAPTTTTPPPAILKTPRKYDYPPPKGGMDRHRNGTCGGASRVTGSEEARLSRATKATPSCYTKLGAPGSYARDLRRRSAPPFGRLIDYAHGRLRDEKTQGRPPHPPYSSSSSCRRGHRHLA